MCRHGRYKNGNPKRASHFICCKCLRDNHIGDGIQRGGRQREKGHKKTLYCLYCQERTINQEVRWCDDYLEMMDLAMQVHEECYSGKKVG